MALRYRSERLPARKEKRAMKKWMTFENTYSCGYCGFHPDETDNHYCDGFGHSFNLYENRVYGDWCRDCQRGEFCVKKWDLEHPDESLPKTME